MGILSSLNPFRSSIDKALGLADQAIVDKDKLNDLKYTLQNMKESTYQLELSMKTIPWVDALHKMGRQILSLLAILAVVGLKLSGYDLSMEEILAMAGPASLYNVMKGKG